MNILFLYSDSNDINGRQARHRDGGDGDREMMVGDQLRIDNCFLTLNTMTKATSFHSLASSPSHPQIKPICAIKFTTLAFVTAAAGAASAFTIPDKRADGGYVQVTSGAASFTQYSGCNQPGTFFL